MTRKSNTLEFVSRAMAIHGNRYDYSAVNYINTDTKVAIVCAIHGVFMVTPSMHLKGYNCIRCVGKERGTTGKFVERAIAIHGDKYDYSKVIYVSRNVKVIVVCKKHGGFIIAPSRHLRGSGCAKCGGNVKLTTGEFIEKASSVHGDRYDYSKSLYSGAHCKIIIICKTHGEFGIKPNSHIAGGQGCPVCRASKGEIKIWSILDKYALWYTPQRRFKSCRLKLPLPFDFVVSYRNNMFAIEFHGKQHYEITEKMLGKRFSKEEAINNFNELKKHDHIKRLWCKKNKIPLLVIPFYKKDKAVEMIREFIGYREDAIDFMQLVFE